MAEFARGEGVLLDCCDVDRNSGSDPGFAGPPTDDGPQFIHASSWWLPVASDLAELLDVGGRHRKAECCAEYGQPPSPRRSRPERGTEKVGVLQCRDDVDTGAGFGRRRFGAGCIALHGRTGPIANPAAKPARKAVATRAASSRACIVGEPRTVSANRCGLIPRPPRAKRRSRAVRRARTEARKTGTFRTS